MQNASLSSTPSGVNTSAVPTSSATTAEPGKKRTSITKSLMQGASKLYDNLTSAPASNTTQAQSSSQALSTSAAGKREESAAASATINTPSSTNSTTSHEITPHGFTRDHLSISAGSTCGWLLKHYETLQSWKLYFYVINTSTNELFECEDASGSKEPRGVYSLSLARLQTDQGDMLPSSSGKTYYCFQLFIKSKIEGKPPKIFKLGSVSEIVRRNWIESFKNAGVSSSPGHSATNSPKLKHSSSNHEPSTVETRSLNELQTPMKEKISPQLGQSDLVFNSPSIGGSSTSNIEPLTPSLSVSDDNNDENICRPIVIIGDKRLRVPCDKTSSNAWLMSEAIRIYMRESKGQDPGVIGLMNYATRKDLDLSEDIGKSIVDGNEVFVGKIEPKLKQGEVAKQPSAKDTILPSTSTIIDLKKIDTNATILSSQVRHLPSTVTILDNITVSLPAVPDALKSEFKDVLNFVMKSISNQMKVPFWLSEEWTTTHVTNGVHISQRLDGSKGTIATTVIQERSPIDVYRRYVDIHLQQTWDPLFDKAHLLHLSHCCDIVSIKTKVLRYPGFGSSNSLVGISASSVPIATPRQFCMKRIWMQQKDGTIIVLFKPVSIESDVKIDAMTTQGLMSGGFVIRPWGSFSENSSARNCIVFQIFDGDTSLCSPFMPRFIENALIQRIAQSIGGLRDMIACESCL